MPETFILYRFFFVFLEEKNYKISTKKWEKKFESLDGPAKTEALEIIHNADFNNVKNFEINNSQIIALLEYYTDYRNDITNSKTELYKLKQEYDAIDKKVNGDE
jgi:hypothetical protein